MFYRKLCKKKYHTAKYINKYQIQIKFNLFSQICNYKITGYKITLLSVLFRVIFSLRQNIMSMEKILYV